MWSRSELKTNAKAALRNFFGKGLAVLVILTAISVVSERIYNTILTFLGISENMTYSDLQNIQEGATAAQVTESVPTEGAIILSMILGLIYVVYTYFVLQPLQLGVFRFYQKSRGVSTSVSEMFSLLKKAPRVAAAVFFVTLKTALWTLLFIIPGIIKAYEYSMVPYIIAENPDLSIKRAFQISKSMTNGHKWDLFVLGLSFILWWLGVVCTCGLLSIYVGPYVQATMTEAYYRLKAEAVAKGEVSLMELPDICNPAQPIVPNV